MLQNAVSLCPGSSRVIPLLSPQLLRRESARTADARKEADTLAALLAKGAVPEDLGEAAGPERLRDLLRALEPVSRNKM